MKPKTKKEWKKLARRAHTAGMKAAAKHAKVGFDKSLDQMCEAQLIGYIAIDKFIAREVLKGAKK